MAITKTMVEFLHKKPVHQPKADTLYEQFALYVDYCIENKSAPTLGLWQAFLNVSHDTYSNWKHQGKNQYLNDTELNDRFEALKKIEGIIETGMTDEMLKAGKNPAALIFYMKNVFRWVDRHEPEVSLNLKIEGYGLPKSGDNKTKEGNI